MDAITATLILLLGVVVSGWLVRASQVRVPPPLVQIFLGMVIAWVADLDIQLKPEVFFLLFLPPLLFLDAWRIPKGGLVRDGGTILALAIGLVVLTVLGIGALLGWFIPSMPFGVAFALAAVLAPTDAVAVQAIAARAPVPKRLMSILEGEALLNDASGLVCMRIAVAAVMTGAFSLTDAVGTFLWVGIGGISLGIAVTIGANWLKTLVASHLGEETGSQILISVLMPFGAYLLAERLHCSGILAAVGSGLAMSYAEQSGRALAMTRMRRAAVWDTAYFTVNGIIFIVLGAQLGEIVNGAAQVVSETGHRHPAWLGIYVLVATVALAAVRFAWAWVTLQLMLHNARRSGWEGTIPASRLAAATTLAGVRGAITMAGVLTLPLSLADGSPFPARDVAICIAAGVIVLSLLASSALLPLVLSGLEVPPEPSDAEEEERARTLAARAGMKAVERALRTRSDAAAKRDLLADASAPIIRFYRQRIAVGSTRSDDTDQIRQLRAVERDLRLEGIRAERAALYKLARKRRLSHHTTRKLVYELDLVETRLESG